MSQVVLTLNAGSSSVKFAIFAYGSGGFDELARGQVEGLGASATFTAKRTSGAKVQFTLDPGQGAPDHRAAMKAILRWLGEEKLDDNVVAVGHRVLHGGRDFTHPAPVDAALLAQKLRAVKLGTSLTKLPFGSEDYDNWALVYGRIETRKDLITVTPSGTRKNGFGYGESSPARLVCHGEAEVVFLNDDATGPASR